MNKKSKKGFTLIELLIVMAILSIVLAIVFNFFYQTLSSYIEESGITESSIEKYIGLEILRKDIEMAGFGLPWEINNSVNYQEAKSDNSYSVDPSSFNGSGTPFAFSFSNNGGYNGSDILVIRSSVANIDNDSARKWGYAYYDGSQWCIKSLSGLNFNNNDYFIAIDPSSRALKCFNNNCTDEWYSHSLNPDLGSEYNKIYFIFGITSSDLRMPFNRVDYYIKRPNDNFPKKCNRDTYILYRSEIRHSDGERYEHPILDCVVDFQVVFGIDSDDDGVIDLWEKDLSSLTSPEDMRNKLKELIIYIVHQVGERNKTKVFNKSSIELKFPDNSSKIIDLTTISNYKFYRWKVIKFKVIPLNLIPRKR